MGKRVLLFVITNLAIIVTLSIVWTILSAVLGIDGGASSGQSLALLALFSLVWGMGGAFISLQISRWIAKRALGVALVDPLTRDEKLRALHGAVERLARDAGLPATPEVGVYDSPEVNAFATGPSRRRSLVAVSTGLLQGMSSREVDAVLGHEVAHIANGDMVTMTLIQGVVNAFVIFFARLVSGAVRRAVDEKVSWLVGFITLIICEIVFGIAGAMVVCAFSRRREFRADRGGADLAGRENMIAALKRLESYREAVDAGQPALATLKIAGRPSRFLALLSTHPPLASRIAALAGAAAAGASR